ncbi:uncharacterized protein LOC133527108 [Cydia pomonella]|uniref:uncharacterized protein LOC133527108 n=1 Tax=Cydia pomonella TaxID=82600 RepID=UPI002ADDA01A|nr:uncharacterized protein LOC133527108 [Cydia pomonella]
MEVQFEFQHENNCKCVDTKLVNLGLIYTLCSALEEGDSLCHILQPATYLKYTKKCISLTLSSFDLIMDIGVKIVVLFLLFECVGCITNETCGSKEPRVLSRSKRYLLFPEGSSFQLVFCLQTTALIPIADIFLIGQTAALAWEMPTDPAIFHMFKGEKVAQRRNDIQKNIYYLNKHGEVIAKVPYKRKPINPVFAKRSIEDKPTYKEKLKKLKIDRGKMHKTQLKENYLRKHHLDKRYIEFHRSSRLSLLEKLETFFSALGQNGRQCVLYRLCKAGQGYTQQGTFLQETLRTIFTLQELNMFSRLPKGSFEEEYDEAHAATKDCDELYPCDDFSDSQNL